MSEELKIFFTKLRGELSFWHPADALRRAMDQTEKALSVEGLPSIGPQGDERPEPKEWR